MRVEVTEEDIECGVRNSAESCPIALAVKRRLNRGDYPVYVLEDRIIIPVPGYTREDFQSGCDKLAIIIPLGDDQRRWVKAFDNRKKKYIFFGPPRSQPFSFDFELGDSWAEDEDPWAAEAAERAAFYGKS